jgi:type VI secretion system secreted protein VgrG
MSHIITAHTPLDPETLRFRALQGSETLSSLYEFRVELVSHSASLDMDGLLGKPLTLHITTLKGSTRYLGGQIARCEFAGRETGTPRSYLYVATLRPWLWYLTKTTDCRIFQNLSVVDILRAVFGKYGFQVEERLLAHYRNWDYCVQYQESDFAFVSRLMEQEGIYYYFRHEAAQQVLVLADDISAHDPLPDYATLPYLPPDHLALPRDEGVDQWRPAAQISTGAYAVDDYDFRKPQADLSQVRAHPLSAEHGRYEKYLWQGGYIEAEQGEHYARVRLEEEQAEHTRTRAHTRLRAMAPGYLFTLKNCPRQAENRSYLVVSVTYRLQEGGYASGSSEAHYGFHFVAQPASSPYRAPSVTPLPKATGPQTALVVGPAGEDIWTDQYGRVKLQFRWDRYGQRDENSSCWVRVSDAWAGSNYGAIHIPRIGQEVVVDFLNGQLDRPLITGRIYNADQMPPFSLPAAATQSGFVTRTPGGTSANANMLRFEDRQGAEQVALHAERNYDLSVENDATTSVGGSQTSTVDGNSMTVVEGTMETVSTDAISITDAATSITGSSVGFVGSGVSISGSQIFMAGSSINVIGSSVGVTGSSVTATESSVSQTGVSFSTVGYSVTF